MRVLRVIFDTNLWISFLFSKNYGFIDLLIRNDEIVIISSLELIEEFVTVASRAKFKKYFSAEQVELIVRFFQKEGEIVDVKSQIKKCRDPKDDFLLNLSIDGKADLLVTGDKDLLALEKIAATQILTLTKFKERLTNY